MIQGLSIAGDVFWILALALMAAFTLAAWKRIPPTVRVPVAWKGDAATRRLPRGLALLTLPVVAFGLGMWLKVESLSLDLDVTEAVIGLGVRVALAPMLGVLQIARVQKALAILEAEGALPPLR